MRRIAASTALGAALVVAGRLLAAVPTPESHFGHQMGADRTVLDWADVVSYFQKLEKSSGRLRVKELGKSTEGRPFIAAIIASPATLRNLDHYAWIQKKLADPRITPEAEAEKLIGEGKAVVLITCSIHATELASTDTAVEFAYRLLTEDKPKYRAILENTILLLAPSINPDGLDIVTRWYRKTLGTPYEGTSPPELYQKYVGHDNNRDWYFFTQAETRLAISQLHNVWHPQIVYDVHQQGPFASRMFVPPWMDPIEPNIDPIIAQECNLIGAGMAMDLTAAGKTGVVINALYDFWTPARHYQAYHGGLRILTESASARLASPITVRPEQIQASGLGYDPRERSWNYLEPWMGGEWHLRDIIDYQLIAWESLLWQAASRREDMLRNFYRVGKRACERTSPAAFAIPVKQRDPGAARKLLETLAFGQVEIARSGANYFISMHQPYSAFAKTLLERQHYPDLRLYPGGPPKRPYDVTAHTLPLLMGVEVNTLETPPPAGARPVTDFKFELLSPAKGLAASDTESWRAINRVWNSGGSVWREPASGDFYTAASAGMKKLTRPRVALYKSYVPDIDEGWTRWLLEQFGFAYTSALNRDIQAGNLRRRFDAIVFADEPPYTIAGGYRPGSMPEEFTGGLGDKGAAALKQFAEQGGTLIFLNHAADYALGERGASRGRGAFAEPPAGFAAPLGGLGVKNALAGTSSRDFYCPGSLLNVTLDPRSPLAYGLPAEIAIWAEASPAWDLAASSGAQVVARYAGKQVLASGWLLGEKYIAGKAALVDIPLGMGHVVLFGMKPQYRAQSYQTFKLLFNALVR